MYISKLAFEKIKEFEGCKLQAYQDAAGVWTIGYGHTYNVREGDRISQWYADDLLKDDIENVERQLMALHDSEVLDMTQEQLDAVVSFVFNLGIRRWQALAVFYAQTVYYAGQVQGQDTCRMDALGACWWQTAGRACQTPPMGV